MTGRGSIVNTQTLATQVTGLVTAPVLIAGVTLTSAAGRTSATLKNLPTLGSSLVIITRQAVGMMSGCVMVVVFLCHNLVRTTDQQLVGMGV